MKMIGKFGLFIAALLLTSTTFAAESVVTKGKGIRNIAPASVGGKSMIYISELDGAVSLNNLKGGQEWRVESDNPALMFEIIAADVTGDKNQDLVAVSGNGSVYAWSSKGKLLWKFTTPTFDRLSEIAVIGSGASLKVYAAGNRQKMYELDSKGALLSTTPIQGTVRLLESGDFVEDGKQSLFLFTLKHDKFGSEFFGFIDPVTKKTLKSSTITKVASWSMMVTDCDISDVDKDGRDDVLLFGIGKLSSVVALNGDCQKLMSFQGKSNDTQRYAHVKGVSLMPKRDEIMVSYGSVIYTVSPQGKQVARYGSRHEDLIYNDIEFFPELNKVVAGGQVGGDNTLYLFDSSKNGWASTVHQSNGLFQEVQDNLAKLYSQSLKFKLPSYQKPSKEPFVVLGLNPDYVDPRVNRLKGGKLLMVTGGGDFSENTSRDDLVAKIGEKARNIDKRRKYQDSPDKIVEWARAKEQAGEPFQMWVGHGTDPFFIRIATLERIIEAAPTTCVGFIYAEMDGGDDPRTKYFVDEYMPRLQAAINKHKAPTKIYFRYKNMFWAADCHEPGWKKLFFSKKYSDILVPSAEDTNNRLQDLNFTGRVGMFMSGYVNNFAMRLVDDNPTSWRPHSPGGQRSVSPYLRNGALMAAYGSRHGVLFSIKYLEEPGYNTLFALVTSGLIPSLKPEDILSVGSWVTVKDVDEKYIKTIQDGHNIANASDSQYNAFVGLASVTWCGAVVPEFDYSKIASGCDYRWLNFMPPMPNGMVPITADEYGANLKSKGVGYVTTNMHSGIVDGKKVDAKSFAPTFAKSVEEGGKKLLMRVDGAAWSLYRVGEKHARLLLVDPGYVDPSQRTATVTLQGLTPVKINDTLTGESISAKGGKIELTVPAGSMRFVDFEYSDKI